MLEFKYRGMEVKAFKTEDKNIFWNIYRDNRLYISDTRTADGDKLQSEQHAINDAKRNIDIILRIDHFKYYGKQPC